MRWFIWILEDGRLSGGGQFVENVLYKIVIPTILFSIITFFPKLLLRGGDLSLSDGVEASVLGETYWFTCALAVSEFLIFFVLLARVKSIWSFLLFGITTFIISLLFVRYEVYFFNNASAPWYYKSGLVATLFLAFGGLYWKYEDVIDGLVKKYPILIGLLVVIYTTITLCFSDILDTSITDGTMNMLGLLMMLVSTYIVIYICKLLPNNSYVAYIGRHSIGFYFFCGAIPNIFALLMFRAGFQPTITVTLICSVISVIVAMPIVYIINRFIPFLFDLRLLKFN